MKSSAIALALTFALCACSSAPRANTPARPAPLDPVGMFDFSTTADGTDVTGTITVTRTDMGYSGAINTSVTEPLPISGIEVEGNSMHVLAHMPDDTVTMTLTFTGDDFTGNWSLGSGQMSGAITGKRRTN